MRSPVRSLLVLALGSTATRTAVPQQQPPTIPTELALALIETSANAHDNHTPRFTVGQAPAGMPASLTSATGGVILGGVEFPERATIVFSFTRPADQALAEFDKELSARGWAAPPRPNDRGGFVSGDYSSAFGSVHCADSSEVMISSLTAPGGGTYLRVHYIRNGGRGLCNPHRFTSSGVRPGLQFPTLLPPVGMQQRGAGSGFRLERTEISTRLFGSREPLEILTHYVKQLQSAGWALGAPVAAGGVAAASATAKDADGADWNGAITATRVTSAEVEVTIHMLRPSER